MKRRDFLVGASALGASAALGAWGLMTPPRAHAGACATPGFAPVYLTSEGAALAQGGAIWVGLQHAFGMDSPARGRDHRPLHVGHTYSLRIGAQDLRLDARSLAPSLMQLSLPSGRAVLGEGVVRGPAGELPIRVVEGTAPTPAPCRALRAHMIRSPGSTQPYYPSTWRLEATLREPLPAEVLGVLVAEASAQSAYGLYMPRGDRGTTLTLYQSPGRCAMDPPGTVQPAAGQRIRLACVGVNGTISVRSNDVEIQDRGERSMGIP